MNPASFNLKGIKHKTYFSTAPLEASGASETPGCTASCWVELTYIRPANQKIKSSSFLDPSKEMLGMPGPHLNFNGT